jgi:hypothetical protein
MAVQRHVRGSGIASARDLYMQSLKTARSIRHSKDSLDVLVKD